MNGFTEGMTVLPKTCRRSGIGPLRTSLVMAQFALVQLGLVGRADAQPGPLPGLPAASLDQPNGPGAPGTSGPPSSLNLLPAEATTPRSLAARDADVVDVRDYGAACDGTGDDGPAFNAATAALRSRVRSGASVNALLTWRNCKAIIRTTINLTGIRSGLVTIDGAGGELIGYTTRKPVIDAMQSEALHLRDISIFGVSGVAEPNIGIQIGRSYQGDPAGAIEADNLSVNGAYTFAAFYNFGSEFSKFNNLYVNNTQLAIGVVGQQCFGLVQDGSNHFNLPTLASLPITHPAISGSPNPSQANGQFAPIDAFESFNDDLFINPQITTSGGCTPIWLGSTSGHKFVGGYASSFSGLTPATSSRYEVILWNATGAGRENRSLDFDNFHTETNLTDIFYVTGPNLAPVLRGFRINEFYEQAANSLFKLDPTIATATLDGLDLRISMYQNAATKVFDNSALWTVAGNYVSSDPGHWNSPATFNGVTEQGPSDVHGLFARHTTGAAADENVRVSLTTVGSGVDGPITAQTGLFVSATKDNWFPGTAANAGEVDGLSILGRQGGPRNTSDMSGMLVNVQSPDCTDNAAIGSFLSQTEMQSTLVDPATNTLTHGINIQDGVLDCRAPSYIGSVYSAQYGQLGPAIQVQNNPGSEWGTFFTGVKDNAITLTFGTDGSITSAGELVIPGLISGSDPANGNIELGGASGTPYIDFLGSSRMRLIAAFNNTLMIASPAIGPVAWFTAAPEGNSFRVKGSVQATGTVGFNGAAPVGRADISGSCGGNTVCKKMSALLIAAGLARGTVTP